MNRMWKEIMKIDLHFKQKFFKYTYMHVYLYLIFFLSQIRGTNREKTMQHLIDFLHILEEKDCSFPYMIARELGFHIDDSKTYIVGELYRIWQSCFYLFLQSLKLKSYRKSLKLNEIFFI